jgi:two-component system, NarL family, sensor kinase
MKVARDRGVPEDDLYSALEEQTRAAIAEIRSITRHLRPPALDAGGLEQALRAEVARVVGVVVDCHISLSDRPLPVATEVSVLRIVQEALTNVARHARATRVAVTVTGGPHAVDVEVTDDGIGRRDADPGVGTSSMRERAEELGGTLAISSGPDGHGTVVRGRIPL